MKTCNLILDLLVYTHFKEITFVTLESGLKQNYNERNQKTWYS
jgi:hypothetical protein